MGSDKGYRVLVDGAVAAADKYGIHSILVGKEDLIKEYLSHLKYPSDLISVYNATEVVEMKEMAKESLKKKDSSIAVAARIVSEGLADGLVSVGNTGASLATTLLQWKKLKGIDRPAIATLIPTPTEHCILLDIGAGVDCKPNWLLQFAIMGNVYAREILNRKNPRVGILSIGEEEVKGNELTLKTRDLLKQSHLNFIGNAEGRDVLKGNFDVIVCDGFVGNILLKFGEKLVEMVFTEIKKEIKKSPIAILGALLAKPALTRFKKRVDYTETGGGPLLGVNGVCIIGHGSSNSKAVMNAIKMASEFVNHNVNKQIEEELEKDHTLVEEKES